MTATHCGLNGASVGRTGPRQASTLINPEGELERQCDLSSRVVDVYLQERERVWYFLSSLATLLLLLYTTVFLHTRHISIY